MINEFYILSYLFSICFIYFYSWYKFQNLSNSNVDVFRKHTDSSTDSSDESLCQHKCTMLIDFGKREIQRGQCISNTITVVWKRKYLYIFLTCRALHSLPRRIQRPRQRIRRISNNQRVAYRNYDQKRSAVRPTTTQQHRTRNQLFVQTETSKSSPLLQPEIPNERRQSDRLSPEGIR